MVRNNGNNLSPVTGDENLSIFNLLIMDKIIIVVDDYALLIMHYFDALKPQVHLETS